MTDALPRSKYSRCTNVKFRRREAQFVFHWFKDCSIRFRVAEIAAGRWLVSIEDNDEAKIGFAIWLDNILQQDHRFAEIMWFTGEERIERSAAGSVHPY
jgi:hypothetical protein